MTNKRLLLGFLAASIVLIALLVQAAPTPVERTRFFISPGAPSELKWRLDAADADSAGEIRVTDYWGGESATVPVTVKDGFATAFVSLPAGYYEIEFPATRTRFGLVVQPEVTGAVDPFFAIDSALSWLVGEDDIRDDLIRILKRSGIAMSRERLRWGRANPEAEKYDWEADRKYDTLRKAYESAGVPVLELFHDSPEWPGRIERCYPDDLAGIVPALAEFSRRWGPAWGALEVWNEPDIFFGANLPADQYVAVLKAAAFALRKAGFDRPILGGSYAMSNVDYLDCSAENGMLDAADVVSFHTYAMAGDMERLVTLYRDWLRRYDRPSMPLWITECGRPWPKGTGRPEIGPDANSALDVTMKAIEAKCCGVARHFPFVYPFYEERSNNFGMMGREATPLRSMAAYVYAVQALSRTDYAGDLRLEGVEVDRARVFQGKDGAVVVLYRDESGGEVLFKPPFGVVAANGIDGRALRPDGEGRYSLRDGILYLTVKPEDIADRLLHDTPAMRLWDVAGADAPPRQTVPSPIVLRYQFDGKTPFGSRGYHVKPDVNPKKPFTVRVFNLGQEERSVTLTPRFSTPLGTIQPAGTKGVVVPASGHTDVTWEADFAHAFDEEDAVRVVVAASGDNCGAIPPLSVRFEGDVPLETALARYEHVARFPMDDADIWKHCSSEGTTNRIERTEEGQWRLVSDFGGGGGWTFPNAPMPEGFDGAKYDTVVIRARCREQSNIRLYLWEERDALGYASQSSILPSDGEWHTAVVPYSSFEISSAHRPDPNGKLDPDKVEAITVGLTSHQSRCVLEVSDVFFVGKKRTAR